MKFYPKRSEDNSSTSQHCAGEAADFEIFGTPNNEVSDWIKENLMWDQLDFRILDTWRTQLGLGARLSYKKEINSNRKEYLMAIKTDGQN